MKLRDYGYSNAVTEAIESHIKRLDLDEIDTFLDVTDRDQGQFSVYTVTERGLLISSITRDKSAVLGGSVLFPWAEISGLRLEQDGFPYEPGAWIVRLRCDSPEFKIERET